MTSSFGIATFTGGIPNRGELIRETDDALYAAKAGGRNLVLHPDTAEPPPEPATEAGGSRPFV